MEKHNFEFLKTISILDLDNTIAKEFMSGFEFPWEALPHISGAIYKIASMLSEEEYFFKEGDIWISKTAKVAESASITGPVIIGHRSEIRHCAYIRGNAIIGEDCVVGNSTELKNVILFNKVQVPHYNYVGDSILGYKSHMGAGAITSNVKSDKTNIKVKAGAETLETNLRKFGAILGDNVEVGCNSVLNPGTIVGRDSNIYPLSMVRGFVPDSCIFKNPQNVVVKEKK